MELKFALLVALMCVSILGSDADIIRRKRVKIHVPLEVKHHKHTHTIIKNIHHRGGIHKQPVFAKESKKVFKASKPKELLQHEHIHHHYKPSGAELSPENDHLFSPSNTKEKTVFRDNLVNIDNDAVETLDSLQSQKVESVQVAEKEQPEKTAEESAKPTEEKSVVATARRRASLDFEDEDADE